MDMNRNTRKMRRMMKMAGKKVERIWEKMLGR